MAKDLLRGMLLNDKNQNKTQTTCFVLITFSSHKSFSHMRSTFWLVKRKLLSFIRPITKGKEFNNVIFCETLEMQHFQSLTVIGVTDEYFMISTNQKLGIIRRPV